MAVLRRARPNYTMSDPGMNRQSSRAWLDPPPRPPPKRESRPLQRAALLEKTRSCTIQNTQIHAARATRKRGKSAPIFAVARIARQWLAPVRGR